VALFIAVVGFLVVTQLRSRQPLRQATDLPTWRLQELAQLVRQQEAARERLEAEVAALRRQAVEYETALTAGRGLSQEMARDLEQLRLVLGLTPVEGPGVRVVLAPGPEPPQSLQAVGILPPEVQAQDLAGLVNELWSAGAEAMAINGVRILATTGIREAGGDIMIAGVIVPPPYDVEAIGNLAALQAGLAIRGGFVEGLRSVGLAVEVEPEELLRLPARPRLDPYRHARPRAPQ
jgi:uncharacterized protein YlxW (UPF0749 family)